MKMYLQRRRQKRQYQADLFRRRNPQLDENWPREHQHGHIRHQTRDTIALVEKHHVPTLSIVDVHRLCPEVAERATNGERKDERDDALEDDDDDDADDDSAVERDFENLVIQEERGELGEHDGGCVGELEDFGELEPVLEGGYWDGGDVVSSAAYLGHH